MKWNDTSIKPYLDQYLYMKDQDNNKFLGIFTGEFTRICGMPIIGPITHWLPAHICEGKAWTDYGEIKDEDIYKIIDFIREFTGPTTSYYCCQWRLPSGEKHRIEYKYMKSNEVFKFPIESIPPSKSGLIA